MKDYCTMWFEGGLFGSWVDCCCQHDHDYSGSFISRREADRFFRECIQASGHPVSAWLMWAGVRLFGRFFYGSKSDSTLRRKIRKRKIMRHKRRY